MKLSSAIVLASVLGFANGQTMPGNNAFKCGKEAIICGLKITDKTMCPMGVGLTKKIGSSADCLKLRTLVKDPAKIAWGTLCPNKQKLEQWVKYDANGKKGMKYDKVGSASCKGAHCGGDPHFLTYDGTGYTYHGQCDLVMAHSENINDSGYDLDIHSRTKIIADWSYMSNVAIRLGHDTFEVKSNGEHVYNGEVNVELPIQMADGHFNVTKVEKEVFPGQYRLDYVIDLEHENFETKGNDQIRISSFKDMLSVNVEAILPGTYGMLGVSGKPGMIARDGETMIDEEDVNRMGMEWQVTDREPMLFHEIGDGPHYPDQCIVPQTDGRRLQHSEEATQRAMEACADIEDEDMNNFCIQDILLTGDHEYAGLYHGN